jgi:hypothetical protein
VEEGRQAGRQAGKEGDLTAVETVWSREAA